MRLKSASGVMLILLILFLPTFSTIPAFANPTEWVSPTGHEESGWNPETNAYDDNIETAAHYEVYGSSWSPWLVLTHAAMTSTKLRFKTGGASGNQQEAYVDGEWRTATYEGSSEGFGNYTFDGGLLTKVRIKLFGLGGGYHQLYVYEVDILKSTIAPPFVDSCDSTSHFIYDTYGWVNVTVHDDSGLSHLKTVDINVTTESSSEAFCLRWTQSTDTFSEVTDANGICHLDGTTSTTLDLGNDYYRIAYYFRIYSNATAGYSDVTASLVDDDSNSDSKGYVEEFWIGKYYAIKDTYIGDGSGDGGNHGTEISMKVGYYRPLYHYEGQSQIWLQFDLSSLDKGTIVENVSLNLYFISATYQEMEVRLRGHDSVTWSETGITWANPPTGSFYENVLGYYRGPDSSGSAGWWQFNDATTESYEPGYPFGGGPWTGYLDSHVNHILTQDTREVTFCLDITDYDGAGGFYNFRTKEWGTPYLSIASAWLPPSEYNLSVYSSPTGVTFTIDSVSRMTPWSGTYSENTSVSLAIPEIHAVGDARYYWNQWSDDNTSRSRTVTMNTEIALTAYYTGPHYQLTVASSPTTGIQFTINGAPQTTPYAEWLLESSYTLIMPETHNGYVWSHWLEDGDPNRIKTILLQGTTWTAVYESAPPPVGGKASPINIPMNKPETPVLWIWLSTIILSLAVTVVYFGRRKRNTETNA